MRYNKGNVFVMNTEFSLIWVWYGIATVMEYLASCVDDTFYQKVSDTFTHNMVKSQEKVQKTS